jgi:PAS domain S-box-containing protein
MPPAGIARWPNGARLTRGARSPTATQRTNRFWFAPSYLSYTFAFEPVAATRSPIAAPPSFPFALAATLVWVATVPFLPVDSLVGRVALAAIGCAVILATYAWAARSDATHASGAESALRASEARYRGIVESQQATVMRLDFTGRILFVNEYCCEFTGLPREAIVGQNYADWVHPDERAALAAMLLTLRQPPYRAHGINRVVTAHGTVRALEWEGATIRDEHGTPVELQSIGRDVTERLQIEEALRASLEELRTKEEMLRSLAQRQVTVREEERKRVGFDLHDGLCQELVGIGILIEGARRHLMTTSAAADLERAQRYLTNLSEHVRKLAGELRPMLLDDLGLVESLKSLVAGLSSGATCVQLECETNVPRLDELVEVGVYRIAQEALTNVVRHAQARNATLTLGAAGGFLQLEIRDDGRGFDRANRRAEALGIFAMEERALAIGGGLAITSAPGKGTTVRLECPLTERATAASAQRRP